MKKSYLAITILLVLTAVSVYGCGRTTIYQQAPNNTYTPPPTTTQTWSGANQVINSGNAEVLPSLSTGVYVQSGKTLNLSWSADGSLKCYICSANQYNSFKNSNMVSITYFQKGEGSQGSISYTVQNADTYYVVLVNDALGFLGVGPQVQLYQATLIEH
jgi:hypothetical protein